ncbi:MAG: hypothetical protein CM1200mP26_27790 [Acidimicrobiales bacterium]|nr:MAG: hypothetical protein CM1200mP26_27790 [Acidimicrobiales bacterium]
MNGAPEEIGNQLSDLGLAVEAMTSMVADWTASWLPGCSTCAPTRTLTASNWSTLTPVTGKLCRSAAVPSTCRWET